MNLKALYRCFFMGFILLTATAIANAEPILTNLQNEDIRFSSLKGKWVFINYWASWCDSCVGEIPELNAFYQTHQKEGQVALFAVNYDALPDSQQQLLINKYHIRYPSLKNDPAEALNLGDITGVPVTFVFNPKGHLVKTLFGGQSAKTLNQILAAN